MTKYLVKAAAIGAGLLATTAAFGAAGDIEPVAPVIGNFEFIGTGSTGSTNSNSFLVIQYTGANELTDPDADNLTIAVDFYDADGNLLLNVGGITESDGDSSVGIFQEVTGNGDNLFENGEIWAFNIETQIAAVTANATLVDIVLDPGGDDMSLILNADGTDGGGNDATDQRYEIVRTSTTIDQAIFDADAGEVFLTFNFPTVGFDNEQPIVLIDPTAENINSTQPGDGAATDFEFTDGPEQFNSGTSPAGTADIDPGSFASINGGAALQFDFDPDNSGIDEGNEFTAQDDGALTDAAGNVVQGNIEAEELEELELVAFNFTSTGQNGNPATAVATFNNPLDSGTVPTDDFFEAFLTGDDSVTATVTVLGLDPNDPNSVLLEVEPPAEFSIGANGLTIDEDTGDGIDAEQQTVTLSVDADNGTTDPEDIFGQAFEGTGSVDGGDDVEPSVLFGAFYDTDGDGNLDAYGVVFDEPIALPANDGFTVTLQDGVTFQPASSFDPATQEFEDAVTDIPASPDDEFTDYTLELASTETDIPVDGTSVLGTDETNNTLLFSFNSQPDWTGDDSGLIPGTGGGDAALVEIAFDATEGEIEDANGNLADDFTQDADTDRANPVVLLIQFFTGDNLDFGSLCQLLFEDDGETGDQILNNLIAIFASEPLTGVDPDDVNESSVTVSNGSGLLIFGDDDANGGDDQSDLLFAGASPDGVDVVFGFEDLFNGGDNGDPDGTTGDLDDLAPGATVSIDENSEITDAAGNPLVASAEPIVDNTALFAPIVEDVNGNTTGGGFLVDEDGNGLAESAVLVFNAPVDATTLDVDDFSSSLGSVTAVALDADDATGSTVVLTLAGNIPVSSNVTITFAAGGQADSLVASDTALGGNGIAVCAEQASVTLSELQSPFSDTDSIGVMDLAGTITIDGAPAPIGTKVFAAVCIPTPHTITASHNNVVFTMTRGLNISSEAETSQSINSFTNWMLGLASHVFLTRDVDNQQQYSNVKENEDDDESTGILTDVIDLDINASNLTKVTFTGTGETTNDKVASGTLTLCWSVLKSDDGTLIDLINSGFDDSGEPIVSSTVITNGAGEYGLHVGAPVGALTGNNRLTTVNWPVIIWVEEPNGVRTVVSSVNTSVNGAPVLFSPTNTTQNSDEEGFATLFNANLTNVGTSWIRPGWNAVPFPNAGGNSSSNVATADLANGVTTANVRVAPFLPFANALEQFVYFDDTNEDGMWTSADDGGTRFGGLIVDSDCIPSYAFTMDTAGIKTGNNITRLTGGFGFGFFNGTFNEYGVFQFGAPLNPATPFTDFPNSNTTQGWGLFTIDNDSDLSGFDYVVSFQNLGGGEFSVTSLNLANPTGNDAPNDFDQESVDGNFAIFGHTVP